MDKRCKSGIMTLSSANRSCLSIRRQKDIREFDACDGARQCLESLRCVWGKQATIWRNSRKLGKETKEVDRLRKFSTMSL